MVETYQAFESVQEILDDAGIQIGQAPIAGITYGGGRHRLYCPRCMGGRSKERNFYVRIDDDGQGATWHCFSVARCGYKGGARVRTAPPPPKRKPRQHRDMAPIEQFPLPDKMIAYFERLGITEEALRANRIHRGVRKMQAYDDHGVRLKDEVSMPVICYPYFEGGKLMNVKYKAVFFIDGKTRKTFSQEFGTKRTLYNIDFIGENEDRVIICEGEDDVLAFNSIGLWHVTTLPDGTPPTIKPEIEHNPLTDEDKRYEALRDEAKIHQAGEIVLACDDDAAGRRHAEEIARRVGKHKVRIVAWPKLPSGNSADAKAVLGELGAEALQRLVDEAVALPVDGLLAVSPDEVRAMRAGMDDRVIISGVSEIDDLMKLSENGNFIVTTGLPGARKTRFWLSMSVRYALHHHQTTGYDDWHTVLCMPEMRAKDVHVILMEAYVRKPLRGPGAMDTRDFELAMSWVDQHYTVVAKKSRGEPVYWDWAMARCQTAVLRKAARLTVYDPFQNFRMKAGSRAPLPEQIVEQLQALVGFADTNAVNTVLIAHPGKEGKKTDGGARILTGNDILGSQAFDSVAEIGTTIYEAEAGGLGFSVWKARDRHRHGTAGKCVVDFCKLSGAIRGAYHQAADSMSDSIEALENDWNIKQFPGRS